MERATANRWVEVTADRCNHAVRTRLPHRRVAARFLTIGWNSARCRRDLVRAPHRAPFVWIRITEATAGHNQERARPERRGRPFALRHAQPVHKVIQMGLAYLHTTSGSAPAAKRDVEDASSSDSNGNINEALDSDDDE